MKPINNFRVFRAQELARKGDFAKAKAIVRDLIARSPQSVGYTLLLADIELFSGESENALALYETAKDIMALEPRLSQRNRRYLSAYANFRTIAVKYHSAGQEWPEWRRVARTVEALEADRRFKRVFRLPE